MSKAAGYHLRGIAIGEKRHGLFSSLGPSTYDESSPMIEYWIEYALTEQSLDVDDLVERLSPWVWDGRNTEFDAATATFLKQFRDTPHRSEKARSFVDRLCSRILLWFAAALAEDPTPWNGSDAGKVARWGGGGLKNIASSVGHLVEHGLFNRELARRHLVKPMITHRYVDSANVHQKSFRAEAIYYLLSAGKTLLQGLLEPEDVKVCFEMLESEIPFGRVTRLNAEKLTDLRKIHTRWLEQREAAAVQEPEGGGEDTIAAETPADAETPIAFSPHDLPIPINIDIHPSVLRSIGYPSVFRDAEPPSEAPFNDRIPAPSSPTLSISTISDLTPTEFDDDTRGGDGEQMTTHHETFYLEDGNVEVVCRHTVFRIHSPIISFSSSKLRDMFSPSTLLNALMPEGCPRIVFNDSPEDFAVLLRMIYTPGFVTRHKVPEFTTFASLLRMATKYGFSDVREALVEDLNGAYPTKWDCFEAARVLGEAVFGSPKPHPNVVLNLFLEQNIKFALPFAAYRATLGGLPALVSDTPDTVLPRLPLASIIHGMGAMKQVTMLAAHSLVYLNDLGVCPDRTCILNVHVNPAGGRREALNKLFNVILSGSEGDVLSTPSLRPLACASCSTLLERVHLGFRKDFVWEGLPGLLGWGSWESV